MNEAEHHEEDEDGVVANALDPLLPCIKARSQDLIYRILIALTLAFICWHEVNLQAGALAFLYIFFFLPRLTSQKLKLESGRTVNGVVPKFTRYTQGRNSGMQVLDVCYICCTSDLESNELQREFEEVYAAVIISCERRQLRLAEITAELPKKATLLSLPILATVARSVEIEKSGNLWIEIETP